MATAFQGAYPEAFDGRMLMLIARYMEQDEEYYSKVLHVASSSKRHEDAIKYAGLSTFESKPEGAKIAYKVPVEGTRRRVVHLTYAGGFRITMEAKADANIPVLDEMPADLAKAMKEHQENLGVELYDDAFAGNTHTGLDGVSLCNTAHPLLNPVTPGETASNSLDPPVPLSTEGLEAALTNLRLTKSPEGRQMGSRLKARLLVVHPKLAHVSYTLLNTERRVGTDHHDMSTVATSRTGVDAFDWPHLNASAPNRWWLQTAPNEKMMVWYNRDSGRADRSVDSATKDYLYDMLYRASVANWDWRGIVGSNVSGT